MSRGKTSQGRAPIRRPNRTRVPGQRANAKEIQLALRLMGGTTAKDKGMPFDDPIPL